MLQAVYAKEVKEVRDKLKTANREFTNYSYYNADRKIELNFGKLSAEELAEMLAVIRRESQNGSDKSKHYARIIKKLDDWVTLSQGVTGSETVKKLALVPAALQGYFKDAKHKWVFMQNDDGALLPYFYEKADYIKPHMSNGEYVPPVARLFLKAFSRGSYTTKQLYWGSKDCPQTVEKLLAQHGAYKETDEAVTSFKESFKRFDELQPKIGLQMQAVGTGTTRSSGWYTSSSTVYFVREGIPAKVVLDDGSEEHEDNRRGASSSGSVVINNDYWDEVPNRNGMADMDLEEVLEETEGPKQVHLPVHPYLRVYDMAKEEWVVTHVDNLQDYPWDKSLGDKLVLKQGDKDLISLLINQTGVQVEDIVRGKMAGVIVLATGTPGVGKTLTAEVFSEMIERPLYTIQCSQLGLDVDSIEKNLETILNRAARWNAILLIDEADVYIRKRGEDIQQNAIVGVFLRLLEYYRGVIFMTSNRGEEIDDAIISRATAWIRYQKPDATLLKEIWKILGEQYGVQFTDEQIDRLITDIGIVSGRTVRNLLKLARLLAGPGGVIKVETINQVAQYQMVD